MAEAPARTSLAELATLFLRLGATAFGGPAVHVAMMQEEVVRRRRWLTDERFLDLLGATNLIPGPNSTELAIHVGWERRRFSGLLVAGLCFILPAALLTSAFGWAYVAYRSVPALGFVLYGVKPVILGVVVQAIAGLFPKAARTRPLRVITALSVLLALASVHELLVLLGAGLAAVAVRPGGARGSLPAWAAGAIGAVGAGAPLVKPTSIFWVFLKTGSVLFGSGYVLLAFLRADLVRRFGWLTEGQLLDAIAVGQLTPGPVFTTATFVGWVLGGPRGAIAATLGIFLPAFVFVALSGPLVPKIRASRVAGAFLDGVNAASLALMAVVTLELARTSVVDVPTAIVAAISAAVLVRFHPNSAWLVLGGAAFGLLVQVVRAAPG
ncbi:MAG TPA: chromate efflux transporter [Polyangiaceae bacterium]|nr:chromate efflux transporter [Polyangiaceae bacterium]